MKLIRSEVDSEVETEKENIKIEKLSQDQVIMLLELADKLDKQETLTMEEQFFLMKPYLYKKNQQQYNW